MTAVTARFNSAKVPNWPDLDSTERYWASYCARKLDDSDTVTEWQYGRCASVRFTAEADKVGPEWLAEALLTALTHTEPTIALRCLLQAREYLTRTGAFDYSNAFRCAQQRLETALPMVFPCS